MLDDRVDAGRRLARRLSAYPLDRPLVLALPRGGVPVAAEIASQLGADLDVMVVRKLGVPGNPEFAMGAVSEGGVVLVDEALLDQLRITPEQVDQIVEEQDQNVESRVHRYRDGRVALDIADRNVILVDDGLATGSTAAAAVTAARQLGARHITVAVPVGSAQAVEWLSTLADDVVCLDMPQPFYAVGEHYRQFDQINDQEVVAILRAHPRFTAFPSNGDPLVDVDVSIPVGQLTLPGHLTIPGAEGGIVVFAHGSGSSRMSPRNVAVAKILTSAGLGTLRFDLLSDEEADIRSNVFDIELLASRLVEVTRWLTRQPSVEGRPIGYFGASTGAAAALVADAMQPGMVSAIVSRGGRPDLAGDWLPKVQAPCLLVVGGHDYAVIDLNREAQRRLRCTNLLEIVRGATHLFEEPGTLAQAARLAQSWFLQYLR